MIKFFRHIRQQMIKENRVSKYLLYAIGEIVLVMIGILLALQVNTWNKGRERSGQERKMLRELVVNLRADSLDHAENMDWYVNGQTSAAMVVSTLEARSPWNDSMAVHYGWLFTHGMATLNTSAYDNLKSIGFDLISNDSIRIALTNLHGLDYARLHKAEQEFAADFSNLTVWPMLLKRLKMDRWWHATPLDYTALLDDLEFREVVRFRGITMGYMKNQCNGTLKNTSDLIAMIERELDRQKDQ